MAEYFESILNRARAHVIARTRTTLKFIVFLAPTIYRLWSQRHTPLTPTP